MREGTERKAGWYRWVLLAALAAAAGWLWISEGDMEPAPVTEPTPTPEAVMETDERLNRETAYERDAAALQALLDSGAADRATQELAAQKLAMLIDEHNSEIGLETALIEAGYANAVVIVQNGAVTVMISEEKLNESSSAQILSLCTAHASVGAENVRVMGIPQGR